MDSRSKPQDMGENTSSAFSGKVASKAAELLYVETPHIFAEQIKKELAPNQEYTVADVGAFKGELMSSIINELPEYKLKPIAIDIKEDALEENPAETKLVSDAQDLSLDDKSVDFAIVRYVLQWNTWKAQKRILKEIVRTTKKFALIEHASCDNENPNAWREKMEKLLEGAEVSKLKRNDYHFSSANEVEAFLKESGIAFKRIKETMIPEVLDAFAERYNLSSEDKLKAEEILGDKNYMIKTDWIIYFE